MVHVHSHCYPVYDMVLGDQLDKIDQHLLRHFLGNTINLIGLRLKKQFHPVLAIIGSLLNLMSLFRLLIIVRVSYILDAIPVSIVNYTEQSNSRKEGKD